MSTPTVKEIIAQYLRDNGYDGLCDYECGCPIDDLFPCGAPDSCIPGYKAPDPTGQCDFWIVEKKPTEDQP